MSAADGRPRSNQFPILLIVGTVVLGGVGYWIWQAWHWTGFCKACFMPWEYTHSNEHVSFEGSLIELSRSLQGIARGQQDFRANDRGGTGRHDYWRQDISGLWALIPATLPKDLPSWSPPRTAYAIKLIDLTVAAADDRPKTDISSHSARGPKQSYWFRAILHEDEVFPSPDRFAACMFPDRPGRWTRTMIIDETGVVYYKDLGEQRGVDVFPRDPLKAGWKRLGP